MTKRLAIILMLVTAAVAVVGFGQSPRRPVPDVTPSPTPTPEDRDEQLAILLADKTRNLHQWSSISRFHGLPSESVRAISQSSDGVMWFGTDFGLARFDGRRVASVAPEIFADRQVVSLYPETDGGLWIATDAGIWLFKSGRFLAVAGTGDRSFERILGDDGSNFPVAETSATNGKTEVFSLDARGNEPTATPLELRIPRTVSNAPAELGRSKAWTAVSVDGGEWFATRDLGVFFRPRGGAPIRYTVENTAGGLRSNEVFSVFVDREFVVWFGTSKGVSRFDPNSPRSEQFSSGASGDFVRAILRLPDGRLFAATQGGLFTSSERGAWEAVAGFENRAVYSLAADARGKLFVGAARGLSTIPSTGSFAGEKRSVRAFADFRGRVFAAIFGGGIAIIGEKGLVELEGIQAEMLESVSLESAPDRLLIGTAGRGVFVYDGTKFGRDPALGELDARTIWAIERAGESDVWFGTDRGIFLFRSGTLSRIEVGDLEVRAIAPGEQDGVWCATVDGGLVRIGEDPLFGWLNSRFEVEEGLPTQKSFSVIRGETGELIVGTSRGIVRYRVPDSKPSLNFTRIASRRLHDPGEAAGTIALEYPQNALTVEVAASSSRTFPEQFQYAFALFDEKGNAVEKRVGRDPQFLAGGLEPGNYRIEIRAFDKNLISSAPLSVAFTIERAPFPWFTLLLAVLLLFAVAALVWAVISQRKSSLKSAELKIANEELETARLDLATEAERERRRISRDLHDQTLADLRHLQLMADKLGDDPATRADAQTIRTEIEEVSTEIRRICEDLSPSVLENIGLSAALEWSLANAMRSPGIQKESVFENRVGTDLLERIPATDEIQIYRIVQEVLSNIARHSSARNVSLAILEIEDGALLIRIIDDGEGFDPERADAGGGRGLANIRSRASLIGAGVSYQIPETGGTLFSLTYKPNN